MNIIRKKRRKPWIAVILLAFFSFPLVYNPVHYLFVSHHHNIINSLSSLAPYHKSCNIDDFNYNELVDFQRINVDETNYIPIVLEVCIQISYFETYRRFSFLLRGPPMLIQ